jgi:hypothetical protein
LLVADDVGNAVWRVTPARPKNRRELMPACDHFVARTIVTLDRHDIRVLAATCRWYRAASADAGVHSTQSWAA